MLGPVVLVCVPNCVAQWQLDTSAAARNPIIPRTYDHYRMPPSSISLIQALIKEFRSVTCCVPRFLPAQPPPPPLSYESYLELGSLNRQLYFFIQCPSKVGELLFRRNKPLFRVLQVQVDPVSGQTHRVKVAEFINRLAEQRWASSVSYLRLRPYARMPLAGKV